MKNYTSRMPVEESVTKIIKELAGIGAIPYGQWKQSNYIICSVQTEKGKGCFKFAPDVTAVYNMLSGSEAKRKAQAEITAWRSLFDFIEIQCDRIQRKQSTVLGAFMEYIYYPGQGVTLMQRLQQPANQQMASKLLTG